MILRIAIFIAVFAPLVFSIWYVPFRLGRLLDLSRVWPLYVLLALTVIPSMFATIYLATSTSPIAPLMSIVVGLYFFLHVVLFFLLLFFDGLRLFVSVPDNVGVWSVLGLALLVTIAGALWANTFSVSEEEVAIEGLQRELKIMHLSDVHIGNHRGRSYLQDIVESTNELAPDIVLITGDLVDGNSALEPGILSPLNEIEAPAYFITGNHEYYINIKKALEIISSHGVRVLQNEVVEAHGIQIVGLDYMNADENAVDLHAADPNKPTIKSVLPGIRLRDDMPVVLMHHSPVGLEYVSAKGVDLMLCGHTHAGQVFPATLVTPYLYPLNKGLHKIDSTYFYVSQGAGTFGPRLRLGTSNEITLIRLVPAS